MGCVTPGVSFFYTPRRGQLGVSCFYDVFYGLCVTQLIVVGAEMRAACVKFSTLTLNFAVTARFGDNVKTIKNPYQSFGCDVCEKSFRLCV